MTHTLKIYPVWFSDVVSGKKKNELRKNLGRFHVGDKIILKEWDDQIKDYTGDTCEVVITHIYNGCGDYGLSCGYSILSIELIQEGK